METWSVIFDQYEFRFPDITSQQKDSIEFWVNRLTMSKKDIYAANAVDFAKWLNCHGIAFQFELKQKPSFIKRLWMRPFIREVIFYKELTDTQLQSQRATAQRDAQNRGEK